MFIKDHGLKIYNTEKANSFIYQITKNSKANLCTEANSDRENTSSVMVEFTKDIFTMDTVMDRES